MKKSETFITLLAFLPEMTEVKGRLEKESFLVVLFLYCLSHWFPEWKVISHLSRRQIRVALGLAQIGKDHLSMAIEMSKMGTSYLFKTK